jgi:hypothetical protein
MFFFTLQKTNICRTFGTFDAYVQNIWSDVVQHTFGVLSRDMSKHVVTWYVKTSQGVLPYTVTSQAARNATREQVSIGRAARNATREQVSMGLVKS